MRIVTELTLAVVMAFVTIAAAHTKAESNVAKAEEYTRRACELVWADAAPYRIERCTRRAMAALNEQNQIRDNELKRLLLDTKNELETCQAQLDDLRALKADALTAAHRKRPPRR